MALAPEQQQQQQRVQAVSDGGGEGGWLVGGDGAEAEEVGRLEGLLGGLCELTAGLRGTAERAARACSGEGGPTADGKDPVTAEVRPHRTALS